MMNNEREFASRTQCPKWQNAVLSACGESTWVDRLKSRMHSIRCVECRARHREAATVSTLLLGAMSPAASIGGARTFPVRRIMLVSLATTLAGLAISSAYRYSFAAEEPYEAASVSAEHCEPGDGHKSHKAIKKQPAEKVSTQ